jgi:hypothetical protein
LVLVLLESGTRAIARFNARLPITVLACGNTKSGGDPQSPFLPVSGLRPERGH